MARIFSESADVAARNAIAPIVTNEILKTLVSIVTSVNHSGGATKQETGQNINYVAPRRQSQDEVMVT